MPRPARSDPFDDAALLGGVLGIHPSRYPRLARRLDAMGGLARLPSAGVRALALSIPAERRLERILELFDRVAGPGPPPRNRIEGPEDIVRWLRPRLATLPVETFWTVMLDARGHAFAASQVAQGILTSCLVHPREVFAAAIRARAASVVVVHNHPSGDPEPSEEDRALTGRLYAAGKILGIPVLDHVVLGRRGFVSVTPLEEATSVIEVWDPLRAAPAGPGESEGRASETDRETP